MASVIVLYCRVERSQLGIEMVGERMLDGGDDCGVAGVKSKRYMHPSPYSEPTKEHSLKQIHEDG